MKDGKQSQDKRGGRRPGHFTSYKAFMRWLLSTRCKGRRFDIDWGDFDPDKFYKDLFKKKKK